MQDKQADAFRAYQERVGAWVSGTFGEKVLTDRGERAARLLEEAAELAQALGMSGSEARRIVADVFAREPGDPGQEVGGLMNTLGALCAGVGLDLGTEAEKEMARVERPEVIGKCRRKNADKTRRGVSSSGLVHNTILFGDTAYEVTQAYAEGVIACRGGLVRFDDSPYGGQDPRHEEWMAGFGNAEEWDHVLDDGTDALDLMPEGRAIAAPGAALPP